MQIREFLNLVCGATLALAAFMQPASAESYPSKPVKIIAPYAAGGGVDIVARVLADKMTRSLGQPVIVDNKTGGAGNIGVEAVAKAPGDGYTVSVALSSNLMINQFLYTKLPYDPQKDLTMVAKVADAPLVLVVNAALPIRNSAELRTYIAANKGKLAYGSWGVGTISHMSASRLSDMLDGDMTHVAYRGEAPMMQDLVAGNIPMSFATGAQAPGFIQSGKLRAIGVTGTSRIPSLPDVPTLAEVGLDDPLLRAVGWVGVAVPSATPDAVVQKLGVSIEAAVKMPDVQARIRELGWVASFQGPAPIRVTYLREAPMWQQVVKRSGAKLD